MYVLYVCKQYVYFCMDLHVCVLWWYVSELGSIIVSSVSENVLIKATLNKIILCFITE